jgi:hypothetical protein
MRFREKVQEVSRSGAMNDAITIRLAENDRGSAVVITSAPTGIVVLFAVDIDLVALELIPILPCEQADGSGD